MGDLTLFLIDQLMELHAAGHGMLWTLELFKAELFSVGKISIFQW